MATDLPALPPAQRADLRRRFLNHGRTVYGRVVNARGASSSRLYAELCERVALDDALLALAVDADRNTQVSNLFFAAAHDLLLREPSHPLAAYYPDLTPDPAPATEAFPTFRVFCLERAEEMRRLITTQRVQTNEVGRCACLLPAFSLVAQHGAGRPLALVEIGASAGLHQLWDRYAYDYGAAGFAGDQASPVRLRCEARGDGRLPLPERLPAVSYRVGLDLTPIDVRDVDAVRWLRALIWPEHLDRMRALDAAVALARQHPPRLIAGDAAETLPALLAEVPGDATLCVYHSYALNQMPAAVRERILQHITAAGRERDVYRVSQEWYAQDDNPYLQLFTYGNGEERRETLANIETHGRWIAWRDAVT